jgi:hypothetical protein
MRRIPVLGLLLLAVCAGAAVAARTPLPGVVTPSGNISCFYVPVGHLLCDIRRAAYLGDLQSRCQRTAGLDWHGFTVAVGRRATFNCSGGILYNEGADVPRYRRLAYGTSWRFGAFTCTSRVTGLTCTSRDGHGLFLSRQSWRAW